MVGSLYICCTCRSILTCLIAFTVAFCGSSPPGERGFVLPGCGEAALQDWLRQVARLGGEQHFLRELGVVSQLTSVLYSTWTGTPYNPNYLPFFFNAWDNDWSDDEYLDYEWKQVANGLIKDFPEVSENAARRIDHALTKLDGLVCIGTSTFCAVVACMRKMGVVGLPDLSEVPALECSGLTFDLLYNNRPFVIAFAPHWGKTFNYGAGEASGQTCDLLLAAAAVSGAHSAIARLYPNPRRAFPDGPEGPPLFPVGPLPDFPQAKSARKVAAKRMVELEVGDDEEEMTGQSSSDDACSDEYDGRASASEEDDDEDIQDDGDDDEDSDGDLDGDYDSLDVVEDEGLDDDQIEEVIEDDEVIEISDDDEEMGDMDMDKWDWRGTGDLDDKENAKMEED